METIIFGEDGLILEDGTPIVCHGLKNAKHLNGQIGDIRKYNLEFGKYEVYFEDGNLETNPCVHGETRKCENSVQSAKKILGSLFHPK